MLKTLLVFLVLCTAGVDAHASGVVKQHIPDAQPVGSGTLSVVFWKVYDATLYAPKGVWVPHKPFALTLTYHREIEGRDIADRTAEEIGKLGFKDDQAIRNWQEQMRSIFPDVRPGTEITGISLPGHPTLFYRDDVLLGQINDPRFGKWFFDIWLSENTTEPELRNQLLEI